MPGPVHTKGASGTEPLQSTDGYAHVVQEGVDYDINGAVTANVDAAVAAATGLRLMGVAWGESGGSPGAAKFTVVHGATGAGGDQVLSVDVAADVSDAKWFGPNGIKMPNGISINHSAGTVDVTLFYMTVA